MQVRDDVNQKFYGYPVDPKQLFDGSIAQPKAAGIPHPLALSRKSGTDKVGLLSTDPLYEKLIQYDQFVNHGTILPPSSRGEYCQRYYPRLS